MTASYPKFIKDFEKYVEDSSRRADILHIKREAMSFEFTYGEVIVMLNVLEAAVEVVCIDKNPNHGIGQIAEALDMLRSSVSAMYPPNTPLGGNPPLPVRTDGGLLQDKP